ncbi:DUF4136 domain-containing protein [Carboxylicivirga sp. RSCT41]|uniref:DUF4136 domain-containing protein n=1 Tax=Carboxylicivirga agarovorans TaxID=3417570 RepID=UPI003D33A725
MKKLTVLIASIFILASCSSTKVSSDQVKNANFSFFSTFEIVYQSDENSPQVNALNIQRIEDAIGYESRMRGLTESDDADLMIVWAVDAEVHCNFSTNTNYYTTGRYGIRGRCNGYGMASSTGDSREYTSTTGTLQLVLINKNSNEIIWIGTAQDELKGKIKNVDKRINKVIAKVFDEFPIEKYRS